MLSWVYLIMRTPDMNLKQKKRKRKVGGTSDVSLRFFTKSFFREKESEK